jgi:hypothetical protein
MVRLLVAFGDSQLCLGACDHYVLPIPPFVCQLPGRGHLAYAPGPVVKLWDAASTAAVLLTTVFLLLT